MQQIVSMRTVCGFREKFRFCLKLRSLKPPLGIVPGVYAVTIEGHTEVLRWSVCGDESSEHSTVLFIGRVVGDNPLELREYMAYGRMVIAEVDSVTGNVICARTGTDSVFRYANEGWVCLSCDERNVPE